ncbi:MAG TPA: hypothetical protein VJ698_24315 [Noviherbaspirillum sp.]|uniref:hypothetical protein n=1 Tax=Noviherbaspirillum sp. TaxID=1926288 RepID=UPI002B48D55B|nr:hypothetical protein [Noviherbaspirillum sp.]HJV88612.1 hypothetical protein [Noviherbaspirillum sp.]
MNSSVDSTLASQSGKLSAVGMTGAAQHNAAACSTTENTLIDGSHADDLNLRMPYLSE